MATEKQLILVVGAEEAYYELIQSFSPDRVALRYAAEDREASLAVEAHAPQLIVCLAGSVGQAIPPYLAMARGQNAAVLAVLPSGSAADFAPDVLPSSLVDAVVPMADREALTDHARALIQERRRRPRIRATVELTLDGDNGATLLDLSPNSLRVRTSRPLTLGQSVRVVLRWGQQSLSTRAAVILIPKDTTQEFVLHVSETDDAVETLDRLVRKSLEVEHYRRSHDAPSKSHGGPVAWQLARRAEDALRQTGALPPVRPPEATGIETSAGMHRRYDIGRRTGRHGVGELFEATERLSGRRVRLKVLDAKLRDDAPARARLEVEARTAGALHGLSGVVPVHDFGGDGAGGLYYALESQAGDPLTTLLATGQRFTWRDAARLGAHLATTLSRARALGYGHHDLCVESVILQRGPGGMWLPQLLGFAGDLPPGPAEEIHALGAAFWPAELEQSPASEAGDVYALRRLLQATLGSIDELGTVPPGAHSACIQMLRLIQTDPADPTEDPPVDLKALAEGLTQNSDALDEVIVGPPASIAAPQGVRLEPAQARIPPEGSPSSAHPQPAATGRKRSVTPFA